jgi:hypothetical protein
MSWEKFGQSHKFFSKAGPWYGSPALYRIYELDNNVDLLEMDPMSLKLPHVYTCI